MNLLLERPRDATRGRPSRGGFTLLEVICAVFILAVALVGLTEGLTTALHSNKDSELQSSAALYAAGLIETLRAEGGLVDGTTDGPCGSGLSQCEWQQSVARTDIDGLHEVTVLVRFTSTGKTVCELKTLLFEVPEGLQQLTDREKLAGDSRARTKKPGRKR